MKKIVFLFVPIVLSFAIFISSFSFIEGKLSTVNKSYKTPAPVIIIDAGHGGIDGGASAKDGTVEKDINLKISLYLDKYLTAFGCKTILTRDCDESLESEGLSTIRAKKTSDIHNRFKIMEETDNSIFISIHQNSYFDEKYSGIQVFYSPKTSAESKILASLIQDTVVEALQPPNTRVIKECGNSVYLIYNAVKPAVLVECGFLSNYNEALLLTTDLYQRKMAFSLALGIEKYISLRNENYG